MLDQIAPILIAGFVMFAVIGALIFFSNAIIWAESSPKRWEMDSTVQPDSPPKAKHTKSTNTSPFFQKNGKK